MPILRGEDAPRFDLNGVAIVGYASPSRGANDTMTWRIDLDRNQRLPEHTHDREEVFHVLDGRVEVSLDGERTPLAPGDAVVVPAGVRHFVIADGDSTATLITAMPVGTVMIREGGERVSPPWTA